MRIQRTRRRGRDRSITLLHVFLLFSGAILITAAITLSLVLGTAIHRQADSDLRADLSHTAQLALSSGDKSALLSDPKAENALERRLLLNPDVAQVELVHTGEQAKLRPQSGQVLYQRSFHTADGTRGFVRLLSHPIETDGAVTSHVRFIWISVALVFLALFLALVLLVRGASRVLHRRRQALQHQSEALMDAYRRLEQSSLEAIESLNATVDAKDPSTAGHSQRVVDIALRIGRGLDFDPARLELLRLGALFHDIGKLAVPDAILLKPGRLTGQEFEVMKRHCEDGARIVDRFGPLRPVVSIIRHHHERWGGNGYPQGLSGETIPLEASIVGLADAWDAMTTNRPYKQMLSLEEARAEVERCCGGQFRPDVVNALFEAIDDDPGLFRPLESPRKSRPSRRVRPVESFGFGEA